MWRSILLVGVALASANALVLVPAMRAPIVAAQRYGTAAMSEQEPRIGSEVDEPKEMTAEERERASLYARPSFELDAVSITGLLGAAIAFQFFVLANL